MKKIFGVILVISMICFTFTGCEDVKDFGEQTNGIYLYEDLTIRDCIIEEFGSEYDYDEFLLALDKDLNTYNEEHLFTAPSESLDKSGEVKEDARISAPISVASTDNGSEVNVQLLYATPDDYADYNRSDMELRGGSKFAAGTFVNTPTEVTGGTYETPDGEWFDISQCTGSSYRYMLCDFDAVLYGDGDIIAFTKGLTYNKGSESVSAIAGTTCVVIFK